MTVHLKATFTGIIKRITKFDSGSVHIRLKPGGDHLNHFLARSFKCPPELAHLTHTYKTGNVIAITCSITDLVYDPWWECTVLNTEFRHEAIPEDYFEPVDDCPF